MDFLETPVGCFEGLEGYPYEPRYLEVEASGLRMSYVDEGPRDGAPILMLHGEPSWSYLYRFAIGPCVAAGHRVIAPDLVGFGRSSKPTRLTDYSYAGHVAWMRAFVERLELEAITLVCQDWGSLIGLRLAAEDPARFARIVIGNGFLPDGSPPSLKAIPSGLAFLAWRTFAVWSPVFPVGRIVQAGTARRLSEGERRAYDAPFPSAEYTAGARAFPRLVPIHPFDPAVAANRRAWQVLERWDKPFLTTFSTGDPITRGLDRLLQARIPGTRGLPHVRLPGGHFFQEDSGAELAGAVNALIAAA